MTKVEHLVAQVEQAKGSDRSDDAEHGGDPQHEAHVPGFGLVSCSALCRRRWTGWHRR
jgi:hypothetical protein